MSKCAPSIGPLHCFLFGNTAMSGKHKFEHISMLTALIAITYIGCVAVKEVRRGK